MADRKETDPPSRPVYIPRNYRGNALLFGMGDRMPEDETDKKEGDAREHRDRRGADRHPLSGECPDAREKEAGAAAGRPGDALLLLLLLLLLTGREDGKPALPMSDPLILSLLLLWQ